MSNDPVLLLHGQPGAAADWERAESVDRRRRADDRDSIARGGTVGRRCAIWPGTRSAARAVLDRIGVAAGDGGRAQPRCGGRGVARVVEPRARGPVGAGRAGGQRRLARARSTTCWRRPWSAGWPARARCAAAASCSAPVRSGAGSRRRPRSTTATCARPAGCSSPRSAWRSFAREQRLLVRDLPVLERRLGEISAPTTIVPGTADRVVPIAAARRLAGQIPAAELVEIEHAGHLLHIQQADRLAESRCPVTYRWVDHTAEVELEIESESERRRAQGRATRAG